MKRKSFIAILAIAMVLVLSLAVLTACNNKKHDFSSKWEYDETSHWHECMTKKHSDVADKADHTFDEGVITTPSTEDATGVKTLTCTVCGYQKTESVPQLGHTFDMDNWKSDAQTHWHPATCAHTDLKKDEAEHTWNEGVVIKPADYGVVGTKKFTCKVCGYEKTEDIDALGAKDNEIKLVAGKTLGKEYDGEVVSITKDDFVIDGNRTSTIMFKVKGADDNTYAATAPTNVGEYTVKVSVAATAEWKAASNTFDFAIAKKSLTATATKTYDGNATMPATLTGVVAGETVTATITMTSKNVGATVKEVMLAGADKDNYTLTAANINASITPMTIGVDWWPEYDSTNVFTGEPAELLDGDEAMITVTMESANVGAAVQDFEITGKDAANYSLAREDVNVEIVKADIVKFTISNAAAFEKGFYVGVTNIPDPTTDYDEIGTGYGERTIVWEMQLEGGVWSRNLTKEEVMQSKTGTFRVRIKYAEGDNYNFGATPSVSFTLNAKPRTLSVKSFAGKTYDGKPFANFTFKNLVNKFGATAPAGVENFTSGLESGEKYVEYRKKGEVLWTKVTDTYIPKNAAEYEFRIGVTATDEWEAVVSEVKTFTIKPYEFVLELGYGQNQNNESFDSGKTFKLRTFNKANGNELIEGQEIQLWLDNEKAGVKTKEKNNIAFVFIPDQKKQLKTDCFFLKIGNITNPVMENYKIVTKSPSVTTVEITVVEKLTTGKSTTGKIQALHETGKWINTTVEKGSFKVGQTVEVYNSAGTKLGEATITQIKVKGTISASGFAIPSDGLVEITLDQVFSGMVYGKLVEK